MSEASTAEVMQERAETVPATRGHVECLAAVNDAICYGIERALEQHPGYDRRAAPINVWFVADGDGPIFSVRLAPSGGAVQGSITGVKPNDSVEALEEAVYRKVEGMIAKVMEGYE